MEKRGAMKSAKAKGSRGERELIQFFHEAGWSAIRSAGSGSQRYPSPDILAANAVRRLAIECKVTKDKKKYFHSDEVEQLKEFSKTFGAESWIGVKFRDEPWYFVMPEDLEKTGSLWAVSLELAKRKGLTPGEVVERRNL